MTTTMKRALAAALLLAGATACVPYTVATTAAPLKPGERASTLVTYAMPKIGRIDSTRHLRETPVSYLAADFEWRMGLDEKSDLGLRIPSMSGIVVNYKRMLSDSGSAVQSAIIPGAGLVNLGQHAHFELTWVISKAEPSDSARGAVAFIPYGGMRLMQVAPVVEGAVTDRPTIGAFIGTRIGSLDLGISPEIGVFYDHSALGIRDRSIVIVPAIAVHGDELIRIVRDLGRPWRSQRPAGVGVQPRAPRTFPAPVGDIAVRPPARELPAVLQPAASPVGERARRSGPKAKDILGISIDRKDHAAPRGPVRLPQLPGG